jgi:hypothetical protein
MHDNMTQSLAFAERGISERSPDQEYSIRQFLGLAGMFALLWCLPRLPLFQVAAMMHDDYSMARAANVYDVFFTQEYRILGGVYPTICKWLFPDFYSSRIPIIFNALMIGVVCAQLYRVLLLLKLHWTVSASVILLFCWHPVINDLSAWNTPGFALISAISIIAAFSIAWKGDTRNCLVAASMVAGSLATYQLMLPIPMCLAVLVFAHHAAVLRVWEWRRITSVAAAMLLGLLTYLIYVIFISPVLFGRFEGSAFKSIDEVLNSSRLLLHESISLYFNLFSSPLSHSFGVKFAMQNWYYVPMSMLLMTAVMIVVRIVQKQVPALLSPLLLATWAGLPFLGILPMWLIHISTKEWRISFIMLIPQIVVFGSILGMVLTPAVTRVPFRRRYVFATCSALSVSLLLAKATYADCQMRTDDFRHDLEIVTSIREFRESLGPESASHRVLWLPSPRPVLQIQGNERALMKATFLINTYSTFSFGSIWANEMFLWYGLESSTAEGLTSEILKKEPHLTTPLRRRLQTLPYVMHFRDRRLSVVVGERQWYSWTIE